MRTAAYVGRVGGLAVAFGIGAAAAGGLGVAWAAPADTSGSTATAGSSGSTSSTTAAVATRSRAARSALPTAAAAASGELAAAPRQSVAEMAAASVTTVSAAATATANPSKGSATSKLAIIGRSAIPADYVINTTDATFTADVLNSKLPVLVEFLAPWCGPCRLVAPKVAKLAQEFQGKIKVVVVNYDTNPNIARQYPVSGWPTISMFKGGQQIMADIAPSLLEVAIVDQLG